ncbi:MAG: substrate-binding domain-containing protein [Bacteroidales bacterium]|nr:substrate-binding domain-containing protein [Bacteroidales bacterium]
MRMIIKRIICFAVVIAMLSGCNGIGNPEGDLKDIKLEDWPLTDCSTSTKPARDLVAYKLLGVPYKWEVDWMGGSVYIINPDLYSEKAPFSLNDYQAKNICSGTHGAYMNLLEGKTDVIIVSRDISRNETTSAAELGVELETAPLAIDALVFIVNPKNPVKNLTSDQVRKIYTGEITNWKEVGGVDHTITPYIRNADSGSQEKMETLVMAGLKMIDGTEGAYMYEIIGSQMASPYLQLEVDEFGIGYTPFFYCTAMVRDLMRVEMISIDGVAPSKESLRANKYPFVSSIYAAVRKTEDHESMAYKLYQFLFSKKGADMIDESGYIAIRK